MLRLCPALCQCVVETVSWTAETKATRGESCLDRRDSRVEPSTSCTDDRRGERDESTTANLLSFSFCHVLVSFFLLLHFLSMTVFCGCRVQSPSVLLVSSRGGQRRAKQMRNDEGRVQDQDRGLAPRRKSSLSFENPSCPYPGSVLRETATSVLLCRLLFLLSPIFILFYTLPPRQCSSCWLSGQGSRWRIAAASPTGDGRLHTPPCLGGDSWQPGSFSKSSMGGCYRIATLVLQHAFGHRVSCQRNLTHSLSVFLCPLRFFFFAFVSFPFMSTLSDLVSSLVFFFFSLLLSLIRSPLPTLLSLHPRPCVSPTATRQHQSFLFPIELFLLPRPSTCRPFFLVHKQLVCTPVKHTDTSRTPLPSPPLSATRLFALLCPPCHVIFSVFPAFFFVGSDSFHRRSWQ